MVTLGSGKVTVHDPGRLRNYIHRRAASAMVERQLRRRGIHDERVLAAMAEVPRELFVPADQRRRAYRDGALRIGEGQTISQPWIVACMAQLLELKGDETVLEVGTGSGYAAAVLSRLCAEVVTIERYESLARQAGRDAPSSATATSRCASATAPMARPTALPFEGISVTATATNAPPPALVEQLAPGARRAGLPGRARAPRAPDPVPRRRLRRPCRGAIRAAGVSDDE